MGIEACIGIGYTLIGLGHFAVVVIRIERSRNYVVKPMDVFCAAFAWPLVDALWLLSRRKP